VTLHNCLAAATELERDGISARVVALYSVKPIDTSGADQTELADFLHADHELFAISVPIEHHFGTLVHRRSKL
jgi:hypothetical protein